LSNIIMLKRAKILWNPSHVKVERRLKVGNELFVEIHKPNGEKVEIEPHVMKVFPLKEQAWGGGIKGIFLKLTFVPSAARYRRPDTGCRIK
jgi:hypothetical protein